MNTYANGTCALKLPTNYVLVDDEEMEYLDGGNGWYNSTGFVGAAIDTIIAIVPFIAQANAACKAGKALNKALSVIGATKTKMIDATFTLLSRVGFNVSRTVVTGIVTAIWTFAGLSIGVLIAGGIDLVDCNRRNGYCFG